MHCLLTAETTQPPDKLSLKYLSHQYHASETAGIRYSLRYLQIPFKRIVLEMTIFFKYRYFINSLEPGDISAILPGSVSFVTSIQALDKVFYDVALWDVNFILIVT